MGRRGSECKKYDMKSLSGLVGILGLLEAMKAG
jgi:hypothetical protein